MLCAAPEAFRILAYSELFRYMQAYPRIFSIIKAYMRPHNIPVILDLVKEVIIDLDSSKVV